MGEIEDEEGELSDGKIKRMVIQRLNNLEEEIAGDVLMPKKLLRKIRAFSPGSDEDL